MNTKTYILLSIVICFFANSGVIAQNSPRDTLMHNDSIVYRELVRFGIKIGGQITAVDEIHRKSGRRFPGLTIGATMQIPLQKNDTCRFYFVPELLYSQEGERGNTVDKIKEGSDDIQFYQDYIALPLLVKGYFCKKERLFVELGPKLSYMFYHKNKDIDLGKPKKIDFGLCLGGGVNFGKDKNLELGARLNWGLVDMYPTVARKNNNICGAVTFTYLIGEKKCSFTQVRK